MTIVKITNNQRKKFQTTDQYHAKKNFNMKIIKIKMENNQKKNKIKI